MAPVYSNFQWRTPLLALGKDLQGRADSGRMGAAAEAHHSRTNWTEWLRAPTRACPSGHYAKFGGEDLAGYPEVWQKRQIP